MDRNRTVVDAVIPPRQSNEARQRDTKAPCGYMGDQILVQFQVWNIYFGT